MDSRVVSVIRNSGITDKKKALAVAEQSRALLFLAKEN